MSDANFSESRDASRREDMLDVAEAIARRLDEITRQRAELEESERFLRGRLRALLPEGETRVGRWTVGIRPNRRFDGSRALAVLSPAEIERCSTLSISPTSARAVLSPERYAACQVVVGEPVVTLR